MASGSRIARLLHFRSVSSFTQIINVLTEVLKESRSISSFSFLIVLWSVFNSALVGASSASPPAPLPLSTRGEGRNSAEIQASLLCAFAPLRELLYFGLAGPYSGSRGSSLTNQGSPLGRTYMRRCSSKLSGRAPTRPKTPIWLPLSSMARSRSRARPTE